jgi:oligoendopeptidase F
MIALPESPVAFADAAWSDIAPYYEALANEPLTAPAVASEIEQWLATWSRLDTLVGEAGTLAMIAYTANTADEVAERAYLRFSMEIFPLLEEQQVRLARRLVELGGPPRPRDHDPALPLRHRDLPRGQRGALRQPRGALGRLPEAHRRAVGGVGGRNQDHSAAAPYLKAAERDVRETAFRVGAQAYLAHRDELAALFDRMLALRQDVAREAGFADFQRYAFAAKHRFDYTPEDCAGFHQAVQEAVVPAVARLYEHRRQRLGVPTLRPWDLAVELDATTPLVPFRDTVPSSWGARAASSIASMPSWARTSTSWRRSSCSISRAVPARHPAATAPTSRSAVGRSFS